MMGKSSDLVIYTSDDGKTKVDVTFDEGTVWLTQEQMAELFQKAKSTINEHIKNIFADGELDENVVIRKSRITTQHGAMAGKTQSHEVNFYNLDMILAVGYRVRSQRGVQFRHWASELLKEYLQKGFVLDDERLKNLGGGNYWKDLLNRIRDIRSSEKVLYRQVLAIYATSVDYNPKAAESVQFFKIVQNKLHYAAHGHTAAEVIFERADADKPFMGLTTFSGGDVTLKDVVVAKNYLTDTELKVLNNIVSGYFDFAEVNALEHKPMYMADYVKELDTLLVAGNRKLLQGSGRVSHNEAVNKAIGEYKKYELQTLSPVEKDYLAAIQQLAKNVKRNVAGGGK